jgi:4-hydroxy 2-oxovalerate aldolase
MKVTNISDKDLTSIMETLMRKCDIDIFCIADSFGNLSQSTLVEKIRLIKATWNNDIGVHLHNNQGRACPSSLIAYNSGVDWIDTTVLGMGRGAGNASTERLMLDINEGTSNDPKRYKPEKLFGIILNEFSELKHKYQWGYNLLYEISSRYSLHPNHIMELMASRNRYSPSQMLTSMYKLIEEHANIDLKEKNSVKNHQFKSLWNAKSYLQNKSVILLGPGSEGAKHSSELKRFIKNKKPVVISLNTVEYLPFELVDIFAFLNEFRIVAEFDKIKDCIGKILVPADLVPSEIINSIEEDRILHHPVKIESNSFKSNEINAVIPYEIVFAYAISAILLGSPNIIYLYGFDGYPDGDTKQSQMLEILKLIDKANTLNVPICSITNSTYPILQKSIYGPQL